jgi:hypothetical protein
MSCISLPKKIYFKEGCLPIALDELRGMKRAFIIGNNGLVEVKLNELDIQHIQHSGMKDNLINEIELFEPDVIIEIDMKCEVSYNAYRVAVNCMDMSSDMVIIDRSENLPDLKISFD